jgi:hypothetical protein
MPSLCARDLVIREPERLSSLARSLPAPSGGVVVRTAPTDRATGAALFGKEFQRRYSSGWSRDRESVSGRAARRTHRASVFRKFPSTTADPPPRAFAAATSGAPAPRPPVLESRWGLRTPGWSRGQFCVCVSRPRDNLLRSRRTLFVCW